MDGQTPIAARLLDYLGQGRAVALDWLTSPAAWSQFAIVLVAWLGALLLSRLVVRPAADRLRPPDGAAGLLAALRRFLVALRPLALPLLAYALAAAGEALTRTLFGTGAVIAFGQRVFLFLAARTVARDILRDPFLRLLARWVLVPAAALYALGLWQPFNAWLEGLTLELGNIRISAMALLRGLVVGGLLFWLGRWSNRQSADFIHAQRDLRPATRELAVKAAEVAIFGAAFLLLLSVMGIDLTAVAVLGGALGVGIGLGLQQIAANFISGIILLVEGQTTVGDYVELDGGEKGAIVKMTARACVLETFDGKWIVVPNEHFITTRVVNYSDQGSANRYEVPFSVGYDTDITRVPPLIEAAVAALPFVLDQPDGPDCELRAFGESGIDFAVEYWVSGIDDGRNKYASQVLFAIWQALRDARIDIPYPHRVVELRGPAPAP